MPSKRLHLSIFASLLAAVMAFAASAAEPKHVPNFRLTDTTGQLHELYSHSGAKAVVLFVQMNGCPIVRQSYPYMEELRTKYGPQGVEFLYINSNPWDTDESILQECKEYSATAPVLRDTHRALAYTLTFKRSAESFVIDPKTWNIIYRGMADDRFDYGLQRMSPSKFWLRDTLEAMVNGTVPAIEPTIAKGCLLDLDFTAKPDFEKDVAPILVRTFPTKFAAAPTQQSAMLQSQGILGALLTGRSDGRDLAWTGEELETVAAWFFSPFEAENPAH